jgi:serine/threonine-protein kinase
MLVGTPAYLAPERAAGSAATPASDLYSLGVVAHECLTGMPPFTGTPRPATAAHQHRGLPPLPAAVPDGVTALVTELTAQDPAARPASASDVTTRAGHLRDALAGGPAGQPGPGQYPPGPAAPTVAEPATLADIPVAAPPPGHRPGWRNQTRPGRGVLLALAATVVLVGLAGWLLAGRSGPAPLRPAAAPRATATAAVTAAASPAVRTVDLKGGSLAGQPVSAVRQQLRQLGLVPRVVWLPTTRRPPGTVVSVQPAGYLATGSTVTVTGAYQPQPHHQDNGKGHGGD